MGMMVKAAKGMNAMTQSNVFRDSILRQLKEMKEDLQIRYGVSRIGVFGSVAREESGRESDVDVVVEMKPDLFLRAELRKELSSIFGREVDVVRYGPGMSALLRSRIDREAIYV